MPKAAEAIGTRADSQIPLVSCLRIRLSMSYRLADGDPQGRGQDRWLEDHIGVDEQQPLSAWAGEAARNRALFFPGPAEGKFVDMQDLQSRVGRGHLVHDSAGGVGAAVVNRQDIKSRIILPQPKPGIAGSALLHL